MMMTRAQFEIYKLSHKNIYIKKSEEDMCERCCQQEVIVEPSIFSTDYLTGHSPQFVRAMNNVYLDTATIKRLQIDEKVSPKDNKTTYNVVVYQGYSDYFYIAKFYKKENAIALIESLINALATR